MLNGIVATISTLLVGLIAWGAKIQSDVNVSEQRVVDLKELISSQLIGIDRRLDRIEKALNGRLRSTYGDNGYNH